MNDQDPLRYPIGPFQPRSGLTSQDRDVLIAELAEFPARLKSVVHDLSRDKLDTPYRPGGWTVRQVVHHIPDSHLQGYVRFKLAVTETDPLIKTYDQSEWGGTADSVSGPIKPSLDLLDGLHRRWVHFLQTLPGEAFSRTYVHPEMGNVTLDTTLQLYVWHGNHHLGHVRLVAGGGSG